MRSLMKVCGLLVIAGLLAGGCATQQPMGEVEKQGVLGGAIAGGLLGAIIGNNVGDGNNQVLGAAIGAALGGVAGGQYGKNIDYTQQRIGALEAQVATQEVVITNDNGSITRVRVYKTPTGYVGPRGEEYSSLPTPEQLKPYYGLK